MITVAIIRKKHKAGLRLMMKANFSLSGRQWIVIKVCFSPVPRHKRTHASSRSHNLTFTHYLIDALPISLLRLLTVPSPCLNCADQNIHMLLFIETRVTESPVQAEMKNACPLYRGKKGWWKSKYHKNIIVHHNSNSGATLVHHSGSWLPARHQNCSISLSLFSKVSKTNLFSCFAQENLLAFLSL